MRVALHEHVVLERARLAFVGIAGDVLRLGRVLEDELPLQAGRESRAAAAAQPRGLHLLDDLVRLLRQRLAQPFVSTRVLQIEVEREGVRLADVVGENGFVRHQSLTTKITKNRRSRRTLFIRQKDFVSFDPSCSSWFIFTSSQRADDTRSTRCSRGHGDHPRTSRPAPARAARASRRR